MLSRRRMTGPGNDLSDVYVMGIEETDTFEVPQGRKGATQWLNLKRMHLQ